MPAGEGNTPCHGNPFDDIDDADKIDNIGGNAENAKAPPELFNLFNFFNLFNRFNSKRLRWKAFDAKAVTLYNARSPMGKR